MHDTFHLGIKALIKNKKGEFLLLKTNHKNDKDTYWDIPGGRKDIDEDIEASLKREVYEEIGVGEIRIIKNLVNVISNIRIPLGEGTVGLVLSVYIVEIPEDSKIVISGEHSEYDWFGSKQARELLSVKYPSAFLDLI